MATGDVTKQGKYLFIENAAERQEQYLDPLFEAPNDGQEYVAKNGAWALSSSSGRNIDGGRADSVYTPPQNFDGGGA